MKKYILFGSVVFMLLAAVSSCKRKMTRAEVEHELVVAMTNSLNKPVNFDSTKAKFDVKQVSFYEEKTYYDCEFIVRLRKPGGYDTTGAMGAKISKDFATVNRKY